MKKLFSFLLAISLALLSLISPFQAQAQTNAPEGGDDSYLGQVLCLPNAYINPPQDCLALGPSLVLSEFARQGISIPPPPLSMYRPSPELATIPFQYILIVEKGPVPVYSSPQDAAARNPRRSLPAGYRYLSYNARSDTGSGIYYRFFTGEWIDGIHVSRVSPPTFRGYQFRENPRMPFGWVILPTPSKRAPDAKAPNAGNLNRYELVRIYATIKVADIEWVMIDWNTWLEKRFVAVVNTNPIPPAGVDNGRWIEVDLYNQVLMVYEKGQLLYATMISTGLDPFFTRPGLFKINQKLLSENMSTGDKNDYYYLEDVPWTMYFDDARALHGTYWHTQFGIAHSHGCVNLSIIDVHWLYDWAKDGEWVYVWDPSGKTPTDPSFYTKGGGP